MAANFVLGRERYKAGEWSSPRVPHIDMEQKESELDGKGVIEMVEEVEYGKDNIIRMVKVKYCKGHQNTSDYTLGTVRKLVKVWDIEETNLSDDLEEMQRKFGPIPGVGSGQTDSGSSPTCAPASISTPTWSHAVAEPDTVATQVTSETEGSVGVAGDKPEQRGGGVAQLTDLMEQMGPDKQCKTCCCKAHHKFSFHYKGKKFFMIPFENHNSALEALTIDFRSRSSAVIR